MLLDLTAALGAGGEEQCLCLEGDRARLMGPQGGWLHQGWAIGAVTTCRGKPPNPTLN